MENKNESIYEQLIKDREVYDANERVLGGLNAVQSILNELGYYECSSIFDEVLSNLFEQVDILDTLLTTFNLEFKRQINDKELKAKLESTEYLNIKFETEDLGEIFKK